jgi:hypothetical protein
MTINNLSTIFFAFFMILTISANANTTNKSNTNSVTNIASLDTSDVDIIFTSARMQTGAFGELVNGTAKGVSEDAPAYIRKPKDLPTNFTGYKVELITVFNKKLSLNDELYTKFGGISIEQRTATSFTYLVGNFEDKAACDDYIAKVIQSRYPNAKGVKYNKGVVVNYK